MENNNTLSIIASLLMVAIGLGFLFYAGYSFGWNRATKESEEQHRATLDRARARAREDELDDETLNN